MHLMYSPPHLRKTDPGWGLTPPLQMASHTWLFCSENCSSSNLNRKEGQESKKLQIGPTVQIGDIVMP